MPTALSRNSGDLLNFHGDVARYVVGFTKCLIDVHSKLDFQGNLSQDR